MAAAIVLFALASLCLCLCLARYVRYEIRVYRHCRDTGYNYLPGWFRIWVRLAMGISGAVGQAPRQGQAQNKR